MPFLEIAADDALYYEHNPPSKAGAATFCFVNAITGDVGLWNAAIVPALLAEGYGTLVWNFRGQAESRYAAGTALDEDLIRGDLMRLIEHVDARPLIVVGLSIGGLYATKALLEGAAIDRLVLINTLRKPTPRVLWMNEATLRVMDVGGPELMKDLFFHLLVGEAFQTANRPDFLKPGAEYRPLDPESGPRNLVRYMGETDWVVDWPRVSVPTLVVTGLQDRIFLDRTIVDELAASMPSARQVDMEDVGHMLPAESPEALTKELIAFAGT